MRSLSLGVRVVAAFVAVAALTALVAALLTAWGLDRTFDRYLDRRVDGAAASAAAIARDVYQRDGRRWSREGLDQLAHELVLTGYDFRLTRGGRTLIDTTRLKRPRLRLRRMATVPVPDRSGVRPAGRLELYALSGSGSTPADAEFRREFDRLHLIAAAIGALVALVAGLLMAARLTAPLRRVAAAARGMASGERGKLTTPTGPPEVRAIGEALSALADGLDRQDRSRRQLAQDLAHELRTPLTLVQSRIEAMQDGLVATDAEGLGRLHVEVLRLTRLIGQIERLAAAEAHPPPLRVESLALDELAIDMHGAFAAAFEMQGVALALALHPVRALADVDATRQIVTNLLSNALKYVPEGGVVRIETEMDAGKAALRIVDDAERPPPEEASRLFERSFRGSRNGVSGGAGLGLTIARELAQAQGGSLDLEATGDGKAFVLRLPRAPTGTATVSTAFGTAGESHPSRGEDGALSHPVPGG